MPFRVLIADSLSPRAAEVLAMSSVVAVDDKKGIDANALKTIIGDYQALLVRSRTKVNAELLEHAHNLQVIGRAGIGVDNIDVAAASRRGILVENAPSGNSITTAEHAICLLCSLARHIPQANASMKAQKWEKKQFSGCELFAKTLGIIGFGTIGRIVANRAKGLKLKVIAADPLVAKESAERAGVELLPLEQVLAQSDFLSLHLPLTSETRGFIGQEALAKVKPGVLFVNAARGGIVDESAMLAALDEGRVGGAAFDVFASEPPVKNHPLVAHPKVICTPHLGASTIEAQVKVAVEIAEQLVAFAERNQICNALNVPLVAAETRAQIAPWEKVARRAASFATHLFAKPAALRGLFVRVSGAPALISAEACTRAAVVGALSAAGSTQGLRISEVNAPLLAQERGLEVTDALCCDSESPSMIEVRARGPEGTHTIYAVLAERGGIAEARLVAVGNCQLEAAIDGTCVVVGGTEISRLISAMASFFCERDISVKGMSAGYNDKEKKVVLLWQLEGSVDKELANHLSELDTVEWARVFEIV